MYKKGLGGDVWVTLLEKGFIFISNLEGWNRTTASDVKATPKIQAREDKQGKARPTKTTKTKHEDH
jgi:hypothetical protein